MGSGLENARTKGDLATISTLLYIFRFQFLVQAVSLSVAGARGPAILLGNPMMALYVASNNFVRTNKEVQYARAGVPVPPGLSQRFPYLSPKSYQYNFTQYACSSPLKISVLCA